MANKYGTDRKEFDKFVEWIRDPLPSLVPNWDRLSPRRRECLHYIIRRGYTHQEIAQELSISVQTVKNHTYKITQITGIRPKDLQDIFVREILRRADELIQLS